MQMVGILCVQQRSYRSKAGLLSEEILTGETREIGEIYRAQILPQSRHQPALFMKASAAIADSPLRQAYRRACSLLSPSTYGSSMPLSFAAPLARLAWRLRDFATNRHE